MARKSTANKMNVGKQEPKRNSSSKRTTPTAIGFRSGKTSAPEGPKRPKPEDRSFVSEAAEHFADDIVARLLKLSASNTDSPSSKVKVNDKDNLFKQLAELFPNWFFATLDTTVRFHGRTKRTKANSNWKEHDRRLLDSFIITGDIDAMWLRDATNQVAPYLELTAYDTILADLIVGLINRMTTCVLASVHSNAFKFQESDKTEWTTDKITPEVPPIVFEGKYELDSLCAFLKLSASYYLIAQDPVFMTAEWFDAIQLIYDTFLEHQHGTADENCTDEPDCLPAYRFSRRTPVPTDTLMLGGRGAPSKRCGLIGSTFRPSDDACTLPFLIPANAMAAVELGRVAAIIGIDQQRMRDDDLYKEKNNDYYKDSILKWNDSKRGKLAENLAALAGSVRKAIETKAVMNHPTFGNVYAFETDGFGNAIFMDDANVPSLLSLPYLGYTWETEPIYVQTRKVILSDKNPYYFKGKADHGIGGPHCGLDMIWPMSLAIQHLTTGVGSAEQEAEREALLSSLVNSTVKTGYIHESFHKNDYREFTRPWFAWACSLASEAVIQEVRFRERKP